MFPMVPTAGGISGPVFSPENQAINLKSESGKTNIRRDRYRPHSYTRHTSCHDDGTKVQFSWR
jgi:hypothetical protein